MNKMEIEEELKSLREKIETVDGRMLRLLNERAEIALEVGKVKTEGKNDLYDPQREGQILEGLTLKNAGPFPQRALQSVFREIISACRSLEIESHRGLSRTGRILHSLGQHQTFRELRPCPFSRKH